MLPRDEHVCAALEVNAHTWQGAREPLDRELGGNGKAEERCVERELFSAGELRGSCWEQRRRRLGRIELTENGWMSKFNRRRHLVVK